MAADNLPTPSRADPRTLVPATRAMYERGFSRSQVLQEIYGVDLPREAVLFLRDFVNDDKPLRASWFYFPWELMISLESGGPTYEPGPEACENEAQVCDRTEPSVPRYYRLQRGETWRVTDRLRPR